MFSLLFGGSVASQPDDRKKQKKTKNKKNENKAKQNRTTSDKQATKKRNRSQAQARHIKTMKTYSKIDIVHKNIRISFLYTKLEFDQKTITI